MKPNPFMASYHFTVPISWTLASKDRRSDGDLKLAQRSSMTSQVSNVTSQPDPGGIAWVRGIVAARHRQRIDYLERTLRMLLDGLELLPPALD